MRRALRKALLPGSPAKRAFALLDPLGRTATPFATMEDGIFGDLASGAPTHGVTKAINELRELGLDIRAERRYRLPPAIHRRRLTTPFQRRIIDAIQAGHDEFYDLAEHLGLSNLQLSRALSRMRSRNGFYVERTYGYRLAWTSFDPIHRTDQDLAA